MTPDTDTDTAPDAQLVDERRRWNAGFVTLIAFTVLVAFVTFALSFYGLEDLGRTAMGLPALLSPLVPLGVDLFSVCGIAATYLLRRAKASVRAYAWAVFLVPTLLSVSGNMAHAAHRNLGAVGIVGAAVAPVVLALSAHLVVVVRRHVERPDTQPDIEPDTTDGSDTGQFPQVTPHTRIVDAETDADVGEVVAMGRAVAVRRRGGTVAEQAEAAGVDERTIRRWFGQAKTVRGARPMSRRTSTTTGAKSAPHADDRADVSAAAGAEAR